MIKIGDIAKATGFSVTTVSKALNNYTDISDTTKALIIKKANELGYIPNLQARGLVMKRSFTFGVMLDEILDLGLEHPFFAGVIQSFREAIEDQGYDLVFISNAIGNSPIESYLAHCRQKSVDGVFILCTNPKDEGVLQLIESEVPTVVFDYSLKNSHCLLSNHYQGSYEAVEYLLNLGHSKIGHIYGSELTYAGAERRRAYIEALKHNKIALRDDYMVSGGYFDFKYGKKAMKELLSLEDRPSAVFVAGDIMALGAIQCCYEENIRIPEDLSIIGFDNVRLLDWITPALTSVSQNVKEIGKQCCELLIENVKNKEMAFETRIVNTSIVERKSCAPYMKKK